VTTLQTFVNESDSVAASPSAASELALCSHCDLMQYLPVLAPDEEASCQRCGHHLDARHVQPVLRPVLFAASALFMLLLANLFPFVSMYAAGNSNEMNFFDTSSVLFTEHHQWLAIIVWLFIQAIPAACMIAVLYLKLGMVYKVPALTWVARVLYMLKPWSMVDIFLMGLIISFVKLVADADISLGPSFWAFCLFCLLHLRTFQVIDRRELWSKIAPWPKPQVAAHAGKTGLAQNLKLCQVCTALVPITQTHCSRCNTKVRLRQRASIQKTMALLIAATLLYIPANLLPIMRTVSFGETTDSTIISGLVLMWQDGAYPVAIIILIASVIVPVVKIIVMFWLCYITGLPFNQRQGRSTQIYRVVDWVGRWSMVDVLVVAIMAALVRFDLLMSVYPGVGALVFAAVVILTMLAALSFDPRLLWDPLTEHKGVGFDART
jgi:paraquat-inducible protein A